MRSYVGKSTKWLPRFTSSGIDQKIDVCQPMVTTKTLLISLGSIFGTLLAAFSLVKILWIGEGYE
jgi:hypothetical protein